MNRTEVMLRVIEMAQFSKVTPEKAIAVIAARIDRLDMAEDTYATDLRSLMGVGACVNRR